MSDFRNASGIPLSGSDWLEAHHRAKRAERRAFAQQVAALAPNRLVDIGCATGLWLEELHQLLPSDCEFVGVDTDPSALTVASSRSAAWDRPVRFHQRDINEDRHDLVTGDVALLFNVAPYIVNLDGLLADLSRSFRHVVVRQYDGELLRVGPMASDDRALIHDAIRGSVGSSAQFRHFDLDRMFVAMHAAPFAARAVWFEHFARIAPFPPDFVEYYEGSLDWMRSRLSPLAAERFDTWRLRCGDHEHPPAYVAEMELVAVLSS